MPQFTPEDLAYFKANNIDPATVEIVQPEAQSKTQTILNTLKAHAGGLLGGGGAIPGALQGAKYGALIPGLGETGIGELGGGLLGGVAGGLLGSTAGQATQNAIQGPDVTAQLAAQAAQGASDNPITAAATDIGVGALASGGRPSLDALRGGKGLIGLLAGRGITPEAKQALIGTSFQAAVNPAISTGMSLANGEGLPSLGDLGEQALGGAVFSKSWLPHGRFNENKNQDVNNQTTTDTTAGTTDTISTTDDTGYVNPAITKYTEQNSDGNYTINDKNIKKLYLDKYAPTIPKDADDITKATLRSLADRARALPIDTMRAKLHDDTVNETLKEPSQDDPEYQGGEMNNQNPGISDTSEPAQDSIPNRPVSTFDILEKNNLTKPQDIPNKVVKPISSPESQAWLNSHLTGQNALKITQHQMLQPNIDRLTTGVKEPDPIKSSIEGFRQTQSNSENIKPLSQAEQIAEQYERTGNVNAPPSGTDEHIPVPIVIQRHIASGNATTGSVLHSLSQATGHPFAELAGHLFDNADAKSLAVPWKHNPSLDGPNANRSHYSIGKDQVNIGTVSLGDARTVMEEAVHSLTSKKLPAFKGTGEDYHNSLQEYLKSGKNSSVKDLINSYLTVVKHQGLHEELLQNHGNVKGLANRPDKVAENFSGGRPGHTAYALGNLHEFIAQALKDPGFQKVLDSIPADENRSVFQKIVDAVCKMLGIPAKQKSMLSKVLRSSGELIKQEREGSENNTSNERVSTPPKRDIIPDIRTPLGIKTFNNAVSRARENHPEVADAHHDYLNLREKFDGEMYGRVKNVMERTGFNNKTDGARIMEAMRQEELSKKEVPITFFRNQAQKQVWNEYKKDYLYQGTSAIKAGQPIIDSATGLPRQRIINPTSHPLMINPKVADILKSGTDMTNVAKLKSEFLSDQAKRGINPNTAKQNLDTILRAMKGKASTIGRSGDMSHFAANRRAEGIPLPDSWTRQDFESNLQAYSARNASDRAHFQAIESKPDVMARLGEQIGPWNKAIPPVSTDKLATGDPAVRAMIESTHAEPGNTMLHNESAAASTATALFIASPALSGIHIPIANTVASIGMADNPIQASKAVWNALKTTTTGLVHARANGIRIYSKNASDMWNTNLTTAERFQALAGLIRKISTFNDFTTKATTGFGQSYFENIIPAKILRANQGDVTAQQFLRKLDPNFQLNKEYTPDEVSQLSTQALGYIHGTSDARTMPAWMLHDTEVSGFLSLAHWSIGQTDRFIRDIYTPAVKGDIKPLLTTVFGAVVGGYLIKELREDISGKKSSIPSLSEIAASDKGLSGSPGLVLYNMIAAMQYSGFGGMFSQIAKYPFDAIYKNSPQGATFPLDEVATDLASTLQHVSGAIANDPNLNWVDLASAVSTHLLKSDFRLGREAYNQAINTGIITGTAAEKKQLTDNLGKLRRFEMVEGLPYEDQTEDQSNPYMNLEQKKFKLEADPSKAIAQLPDLISNIVAKYGNTPEVMLSKFKSLKENSYATFPSMENAPMSFFKYVDYLNKTEGPEQAQDALKDYLQHKTINTIKASVVP